MHAGVRGTLQHTLLSQSTQSVTQTGATVRDSETSPTYSVPELFGSDLCVYSCASSRAWCWCWVCNYGVGDNPNYESHSKWVGAHLPARVGLETAIQPVEFENSFKGHFANRNTPAQVILQTYSKKAYTDHLIHTKKHARCSKKNSPCQLSLLARPSQEGDIRQATTGRNMQYKPRHI